MVSQALTLYTTPVIYLYMDRLQHAIPPAQACCRDSRRSSPNSGISPWLVADLSSKVP